MQLAVDHPTRRRLPWAGFSLIEVLIASLILATALIALTSLFIVGMKNNSAAKEDTIMAALAQDKVELLKRLPRNALDSLLPAACQGSCPTSCACGDACDTPGVPDDCCDHPCYPMACGTSAANRVFTFTESPVTDPNPTDRVNESLYVRRWTVEKVDLGAPVGCVYKIVVNVGSRAGLFAPEPPGGGRWVDAADDSVLDPANPRRVELATYRR